ncbi:MAG: hypothetical protein C5B52_13555 [Bacteroidetes bacterium]|nr:MAG: hypothetical protein C5B52_13555 [Bacteroidota bacterium]
MKKLILSLLIISLIKSGFSQEYFEGVLSYKISATTRLRTLPEKTFKTLMGVGDEMTCYIKKGFMKQVSGFATNYYIASEKRIYTKFDKIDTLYYRDFDSDTSLLLDSKKTDGVRTVCNISCNSFMLKTHAYKSSYYYTVQYRTDPNDGIENSVAHYNEFIKACGGSLWLMSIFENPAGILTDSCTKIEKRKLDDAIFKLPDLPKKDFTKTKFSTPVKFPGGQNEWINYLSKSINSKIAAQYVSLPKGEPSASVRLMVGFIINENGQTSEIEILNEEPVHPKLAEEAIRVIRESPNWIPATVYGENVTAAFKQPITFRVDR